MYNLYLEGIQFPTPPKMTVKIKGQNKSVTLLDGGELNFLRSPGLTEITLPLTLTMLGAEYTPNYYLSYLADFMEEKKPLRFILNRISPTGALLYDTNMLVSIEDYTTIEDAKEGLDVSVEISLKRYVEHKTIRAKVEQIEAHVQPETGKETEKDTSSKKNSQNFTNPANTDLPIVEAVDSEISRLIINYTPPSDDFTLPDFSQRNKENKLTSTELLKQIKEVAGGKKP